MNLKLEPYQHACPTMKIMEVTIIPRVDILIIYKAFTSFFNNVHAYIIIILLLTTMKSLIKNFDALKVITFFHKKIKVT
jgi:hypothetical protein